MILHYKCPSCGSDMSFDSESGELACDSCGRQDKIESYPEDLITTTFSEDEAKEYHCENCGAVLITEAETTATSCSFCGAGVVIADRLSGHLAPAKVIPFTISKEEATKAFQKWCRKGLLTPKGFMNADRIKSITGMYVPFWLFDLNSKVQVNAVCTKVRMYTRGEYIYTETKYYDAFRDINLDYVKIPVDASEKMNDGLMDKLEPYPYDQLKNFKTPYLAGYIAEKYNYTDEELLPRAKDKISGYIDSYIRSTLTGYHSVNYKEKTIDTRNVNSYYVLLPVWMVIYDYNQSEHTFAMNGQTGKVVGKPPISSGKVSMWFGGIAAGSLLALKCASYFLGGGFW
ncbi:DNA-directed RNA polymerase subunit RPC12/RpoP [Cytobacillus eiseniae]|uniref:DNA-directed RNA polymerase subunit RPC12/RpoP n=1 Tax=Cytobacillus eiseniae TaxID=762947 RepID=A0ABS4R9D6_9BACI|nr:TFIIB-type zinc ribbon-containing protein [Cytobacillus eiseniae]MBP2239496.1 DNA-directed RNA polymerase subunit RPC12/RpoP [Cytobacillus eiseniae]